MQLNPATNDSDEGHEPWLNEIPKSSPLWRDFEEDVQQHLASRFTDVVVSHNEMMEGHISHHMRQVDVLLKGTIAGMDISVVVECKRNESRPLHIGVVDAFAGKLQDIGAEKGVLWAFGGFDSGAVARAERAINPKIELRTLRDFEDGREIDDEFFSRNDCPNDSCWFGEVSWQSREEGGVSLEYGTCDHCGTLAARCPECEDIAALDSGTVECLGCSGSWTVTYSKDYEFAVDWSP